MAYIVVNGSGGILAVFTTRALADSFIKARSLKVKGINNLCRVEEYELKDKL